MLKRISDGIRDGMTFEQAMLKLGYSPSYANSSTHLKETDSWNALLEQELGDGELLKVHKELLHNRNWRARDSALDKGYKLKKKYDNTLNIKHGLANLTDEELDIEFAGVIRAVSEGIGDSKRKSKTRGKQ